MGRHFKRADPGEIGWHDVRSVTTMEGGASIVQGAVDAFGRIDAADDQVLPIFEWWHANARKLGREELDTTNPDEIDSNASCWCNLTQHVVGPDDSGVDRLSCIAGRGCFKAR